VTVASLTTTVLRSETRRLARLLSRVLRLPPRELLTTLHVVVVLAVVESLIRFVALPNLTRLLSVRLNLEPASQEPEQFPVADLPERARRQLLCTGRVADHWQFSKGPCLRRALVAGHLLRDLGPAVCLGVATDGASLLAHAWLEIDGRPLEPVAGFTRFERRPVASGR
jgi:hypothetical protein